MATHSFTRQELYELAWSEQIVKLAARYGISGNGLAKACQRANIPVPERGYWARSKFAIKLDERIRQVRREALSMGLPKTGSSRLVPSKSLATT